MVSRGPRGGALAPAVRSVRGPLRWVSAVVLLALAAHGAWQAVRRHRAPRTTGRATSRVAGAGAVEGGAAHGQLAPRRAYFGLLGITVLNPLTVIYFTALVVGGGGPDHGVALRAVFVIAAFAASASWQLLLAGGGALLGRALTGPRTGLATALASSTLIAALAVRMVR
ncbi:hypothetical protein [Streptomyces beihaiensis]|uniref:hypothetical protein n=1 Tax=Streptomyces beihaiensis TaxID=2984495 RepID=UPI002B1CE1FD|nr:hypothetical protein [Streptomyces beihaiensis]